MKRIISAVLILAVLCICLVSCADKTDISNLTGKYEFLSTKLENTLELQKNVFSAKILSVEEKDALITKYNIDITTYTVFTVEITESFDSVTPLGRATVYWLGGADEFLARVNLVKNETYILDAEPWVYDGGIVYLLPQFNESFPKIDSASRVTLIEDGENKDCGNLDDYKKSYVDAKKSLEQKQEGFFSNEKILSRYKEMFSVIKEKNDKDWTSGFDYKWTPSDKLIEKTRAYTDKVCNYIDSLSEKETLTAEDFTNIFRQ